MAQWSVQVGDILAHPADLLICPANPWLNLSGGLGGQLLRQCGEPLQQELHAWLASRGLKSVPQGTIVPTAGFSLPFHHVIHAVAIDPFYDSSANVISAIVQSSLAWATENHCQHVVLAALGTGFGRLSHADFGSGIAALTRLDWPNVENVVVVLRSETDREELLSTCRISADPP
jgi:O-acetyl-ADP-ribose deacetylase (regulator of RNase III)